MKRRNKKQVLYIESNTDGTVGGSYFSLFLLVEGLNKNIYSPIVIFYQENRLFSQFRKAGCRVLLFIKNSPIDIFEFLPWIKNISSNKIINLFLIFPLIIFQKGINYFKTFFLPTFNCWQLLKRENISITRVSLIYLLFKIKDELYDLKIIEIITF